jgi:uncharacterized protein (DUF305 family)
MRWVATAKRTRDQQSMNSLLRAASLPTTLTSLALAGAISLGLTACASARPAGPVHVMGQEGAIARARADSLRYPYTPADIDFMKGMIHHHAQAITMSRLVPARRASPSIQRLSERIINAQSDEITLMQNWLKDRNQQAPLVDSTGAVSMGNAAGHAAHGMPGHDMASMPGGTMMPGMLTDAQMKELATANGAEFDRLFLTYMIQHHRGAVGMVKKLFSSRGAGQDETVFKFANDVEVDQSTEIRRMLSMMLEMGFPLPPG